MAIPHFNKECGCLIHTSLHEKINAPFWTILGKVIKTKSNNCRLNNPSHTIINCSQTIKIPFGKIIGRLVWNEGNFGRYIETDYHKNSKYFLYSMKDVYCYECDEWHFS
jgi:hypothetical protein